MADKLDYKKVYKDLYQPGTSPALVDVPPIAFFMVDGSGAPEDGCYQNAVGALYAATFTIKMSKMGNSVPSGYYEYTVPPLEGLWDGDTVGAPGDRHAWRWTSMIRQPEFVTEAVAAWALEQAARKKPELDFSGLRFATFAEGLCVQALHRGPFATEPETMDKINVFMRENGLVSHYGNQDAGGTARRHHEIYLGDPRRTTPDKMRTVLRHPVARG